MRGTIIIIITLLAGCATTPTSSRDASAIPASKHIAYTEPNKTTAPVLIIRDSCFMGSACDTKVTVNGQLTAYLGSGEKVTLHIPTGEVIIGIEASGICAGGLQEKRVSLIPGKMTYLRIGYDTSGALNLNSTIAR